MLTWVTLVLRVSGSADLRVQFLRGLHGFLSRKWTFLTFAFCENKYLMFSRTKFFSWPLKRKPNKMINTLKPTNCLSAFDHYFGLALKGLKHNICMFWHKLISEEWKWLAVDVKKYIYVIKKGYFISHQTVNNSPLTQPHSLFVNQLIPNCFLKDCPSIFGENFSGNLFFFFFLQMNCFKF